MKFHYLKQLFFFLAFWGFLRVGEFSSASKTSDTSRVLALRVIKMGKSIQDGMVVTIRYS